MALYSPATSTASSLINCVPSTSGPPASASMRTRAPTKLGLGLLTSRVTVLLMVVVPEASFSTGVGLAPSVTLTMTDPPDLFLKPTMFPEKE